MSIEYKTEAQLVLKAGVNAAAIAIKWVKGESSIRIHQGQNHIDLDKRQLLELASFTDVVGDDLKPGQGTLEKPE